MPMWIWIVKIIMQSDGSIIVNIITWLYVRIWRVNNQRFCFRVRGSNWGSAVNGTIRRWSNLDRRRRVNAQVGCRAGCSRLVYQSRIFVRAPSQVVHWFASEFTAEWASCSRKLKNYVPRTLTIIIKPLQGKSFGPRIVTLTQWG